jgi:toxin-antitoxin system PIN domain toxin
MTIIDANLLLYAYDSSSPFHAKARAWIEGAFSDGRPVGLPWQSVTAFLRIATNPRLPGPRFTMQEAVAIVESWTQQPSVRFVAPGDAHWPLLRSALTDGQATGPLVSDAELAALTIEHGGTLHTTDRDFARFEGLRWTNPLA